LSLAIVPGHHISSLSLAKKSTASTTVDKLQESDKNDDEIGKDGDDEKNGESTEQHNQPHETVNTPVVVT